MSKRIKSKPLDRGFVLYDVYYEDGSRTSNRRVPIDVVKGIDGDAGVRQAIEAQDEAIAERSGRPRLVIDRLVRVKT